MKGDLHSDDISLSDLSVAETLSGFTEGLEKESSIMKYELDEPAATATTDSSLACSTEPADLEAQKPESCGEVVLEVSICGVIFCCFLMLMALLVVTIMLGLFYLLIGGRLKTPYLCF